MGNFIEELYYGNIDPQEMKSELTEDIKLEKNNQKMDI